ncbi:MAG: RNA-binding S4 domain-containing protein [Clostridiales bacterium]|nr:RNA-binding S4 domain-containing protein [Clostridiales bacterium]
MRIDKFLKVSRILKRRSVSADAAKSGNVFVNDRAVKPSYRLKIGDVVRVQFSSGSLTFVVKALNEKASKEEAASLYEII